MPATAGHGCRQAKTRTALKKILIIKMSALGDVFMALPHIDAILAQYVKDQVWIITSPPFQDLFVNHPRLNVSVLDRKKFFGRENSYAKILWVRKQRFDAVYDLQGNRTSRLLVRFSNSPIRVGTQPLKIYNFHPERFYDQDTPQNVFERLNETIASAGLPPAAAIARLYPSEADLSRLAAWKAARNLETGCFVLLHAGSSGDWPSKRWPEKYFVEFARLVEKSGLNCVWIGSEADRGINRALSKDIGIDATGELSVLQLYLLGKEARFAVTNDSGPMHILAAAGLPVYSFFGPTNWVRSHAAGQAERVFSIDMDCSPCFLKRCLPQKNHACMKKISPEYVYRKIRKETGL